MRPLTLPGIYCNYVVYYTKTYEIQEAAKVTYIDNIKIYCQSQNIIYMIEKHNAHKWDMRNKSNEKHQHYEERKF